MSGNGKLDEVKGRAKEAAGALADDDELKRSGRIDQAVGELKEQADKLIDRVRDALDSTPRDRN